MNKIDWNGLSKNPNAIHILEKNLDKVNWDRLSCNPNAIHICEKNLDKVNWQYLSGNPNAIHILEKNLEFFMSRTFTNGRYETPVLYNTIFKIRGIIYDTILYRIISHKIFFVL